MKRFDRYSECICENCGSHYLHQYKTEVFNMSEDGNGEKLHVSITQCKIDVSDEDMKNNPSERRSGISIFFACEFCQAETRLDIVQHKGSTYINSIITNRLILNSMDVGVSDMGKKFVAPIYADEELV